MGEENGLFTDEDLDTRKKRRVCFRDVDPGIDPGECFKIYLVACKEEVDSEDAFLISPVNLDAFFDDSDGKIYGYQELEITVWISILSFSAFVEVSYDSEADCGKGITDLKSALLKMLGDTLVDNKDTFLLTFTSEVDFISSITSLGEKVFPKLGNGHVDYEEKLANESYDVKVVRLKFDNPAAAYLYCRLAPLVLLLVDGSNTIEVTDPNWELYALVISQDNIERLVGFTAIYRFYRYPEHFRFRLGQILVLPPYQGKGYGRNLLEEVHNVAVSEGVYDLTVEEPLDYFQQVRCCFDIERLVNFPPIQEPLDHAVSLVASSKKNVNPTARVIDDVRQALKITRKHFYQCWEVLLYLRMRSSEESMSDFTAMLSDRVKIALLGRESKLRQLFQVANDYNPDMSFVVTRTFNPTLLQAAQNQPNLEDQLANLVRERVREIETIIHKLQM